MLSLFVNNWFLVSQMKRPVLDVCSSEEEDAGDMSSQGIGSVKENVSCVVAWCKG